MTKYMTSVDLNYAYVTTPIALEGSKYLHFFLASEIIMVCCLPFGLYPVS